MVKDGKVVYVPAKRVKGGTGAPGSRQIATFPIIQDFLSTKAGKRCQRSAEATLNRSPAPTQSVEKPKAPVVLACEMLP